MSKVWKVIGITSVFVLLGGIIGGIGYITNGFTNFKNGPKIQVKNKYETNKVNSWQDLKKGNIYSFKIVDFVEDFGSSYTDVCVSAKMFNCEKFKLVCSSNESILIGIKYDELLEESSLYIRYSTENGRIIYDDYWSDFVYEEESAYYYENVLGTTDGIVDIVFDDAHIEDESEDWVYFSKSTYNELIPLGV